MTIISSSEARATLPDLLNRVVNGEEVTITRHGRPVAVMVRPDALRVRRADRALALANKVRDALEAGRAAPLSSSGGLTAPRAEELVAEVRASRKRR
jgi:antitoxin (DNA-binding transcriptional repressor) of toxin-antitoxin stability system